MKWLALSLVIAAGAWLLFLGDRAPGTDAARRGFPLDDAWTHMVYARSLAEDGSLDYNPGEPEAGMTSPLWVVLLAGVHAVAGPGNVAGAVAGAKLLSLLFGLCAIALLWAIARRLGEGRPGALLAAALAALDPSLAYARASGMEVPLFVALTLLALWLALRGRVLGAAAAAGLAVVARPEGVIVLPLVLLALLRAARGGSRPAPLRAALAAAFASAPALAWAAFCLHATGRPLPNTFYAKFHAPDPAAFGALARGWRDYVHGNLPYFTLEAGSVLALLGTFRLLRRDPAGATAVLGCGTLLFAATLTSRTFASGHYFYWERWLVPAFPFLLLAMAAGVAELGDGLPSFRRAARPADVPGGRRRRTRSAGSIAVAAASAPRVSTSWRAAAAAAALVLAARLPGALRERADAYAWNAQNIEEMNVALGRWIDARLPADAVIAVQDAGALRYFGKRTTIDLFGLNHHRFLVHDPALGPDPLATLGVGWMVIAPGINAELLRLLPLRPIHEARAARYTICEAAQDRLVVYRLERR